MSVWWSKVLLGTAVVLLPGALLMLPLFLMLYRRYSARAQQQAALVRLPATSAQPVSPVRSLPPQL